MDVVLWIIGGVALVFIVAVIAIYNGLVQLRVRSEEAWSDIDVQLKRRYDLIPNLIETVKGYATHEKQLFENVAKARSEAMQAGNLQDKAEKENAFTNTIKSLFAVAENYPQLRASENFMALQTELSDTENKIEASRRFYNANVRDLNIKIQTFPSNIVAGSFGFKSKELFETAETEKAAPQVKF